jgi:hypothetical protein
VAGVIADVATWVALLLAGVAGLGLGIGLVVGAAIARSVRDEGRHRD